MVFYLRRECLRHLLGGTIRRANGEITGVRYYRKSILSVRNVIILTLFPALLSSFRKDYSYWPILAGFIVLLEVLKYRFPRISGEIVPENLVFGFWVLWPTLWSYFYEKHSLRFTFFVLVAYLGIFGLVKLSFRAVYWEIQFDRVIQRLYFRRTVFLFSEIDYVGPMTGAASLFDHFGKHILIQNVSGETIFVRTPKYEAFLKEMNKHLPLITRDLPLSPTR